VGRRATRGGACYNEEVMNLANIFFVLVIISGLATLGVLFAGIIGMGRKLDAGVEGAKSSNRLMWWRVRLQILTLVLIGCWYLASRGA
jgi:hypothetical protein